MEPETLKISVAEEVGTKDHGPGQIGGGKSKEEGRKAFANFLKENGYLDDGTFILTAHKEKKEATLWKKVAVFNGEITT